jgi:hypothetical protein
MQGHDGVGVAELLGNQLVSPRYGACDACQRPLTNDRIGSDNVSSWNLNLEMPGSYLGYTGRPADVVARAAFDRCYRKRFFWQVN